MNTTRFGKYQAIEVDADGRLFYGRQVFRFDTAEDLRDGLLELADEGWRFAGLHIWHLNPLDTVYIHQEAA